MRSSESPGRQPAEARRRAGDALESIGAHIGSNVESVEPFEQLPELLATTHAERVDIGGGVASMALVPAVAKAIRETLAAELILLELGRTIVADVVGSSPASPGLSASTWWRMLA